MTQTGYLAIQKLASGWFSVMDAADGDIGRIHRRSFLVDTISKDTSSEWILTQTAYVSNVDVQLAHSKRLFSN